MILALVTTTLRASDVTPAPKEPREVSKAPKEIYNAGKAKQEFATADKLWSKADPDVLREANHN